MTMLNSDAVRLIIFLVAIAVLLVSVCCLQRAGCFFLQKRGSKSRRDPRFQSLPMSQFRTLKMDEFLDAMAREKPFKFTPLQLIIATDNFSHQLGAGGFGTVYKGSLADDIPIAVKVLRGSSDERIEEQFTAEVSTIGRTHHLHLVRLYGFCYESDLQALVYEYMPNGSLDKILFGDRNENTAVDRKKLHDIAVGTARGIAYLHQECHQRIIHYDIKPANVLLDDEFRPKVADFGLAKLLDRDKTHVTMTGGRGTPGYAAPELWLPFPVTHKCDVYSFGMLLFEVLGRKRNYDAGLPESQEWFPMWMWKRFERGEIEDAMAVCGIEEEEDREEAARMAAVALLCVQYEPEARPWMSDVVKMLEGGVEIPLPPNPFQYLVGGSYHGQLQTWSETGDPSRFNYRSSTPTIRRNEIQIACR